LVRGSTPGATLQPASVQQGPEWAPGKGDEALGDWGQFPRRSVLSCHSPIPDAPGKYVLFFLYGWFDCPVRLSPSPPCRTWSTTASRAARGETAQLLRISFFSRLRYPYPLALFSPRKDNQSTFNHAVLAGHCGSFRRPALQSAAIMSYGPRFPSRFSGREDCSKSPRNRHQPSLRYLETGMKPGVGCATHRRQLQFERRGSSTSNPR